MHNEGKVIRKDCYLLLPLSGDASLLRYNFYANKEKVTIIKIKITVYMI